MTENPSTDTAAAPTSRPVTVPIDKIRSAFVRYRVMAWVTGVWLLVLVAEMIAKYGYDVDLDIMKWVPIVHGWAYVLYLIFTVDLAVKIRWPAGKTILTCLAGTIPFLSFWVEHKRTQEVRAEFGL
ncbi:DUF3817 domain-containing protein [Gordonia iterans]|uniref:DUF3817 domain-containing protein n=1 Tax=Gordonia iterans TaxID=1004901 RepID=A0A2S0KEY6_9ACTN|nr:DUF3817 domain-containing protein [Gordonia iterans]AVM00216.1 DUF3817 domain-containing protein [Gordonia iterans]